MSRTGNHKGVKCDGRHIGAAPERVLLQLTRSPQKREGVMIKVWMSV